MPRRALFRCDASPYLGGGHVMRCLTLAENLREVGYDCTFMTAAESVNFVPALARSGFKITGVEIDTVYDVLIVDHYDLDERWEREMRPFCRYLVAIDDLADRRHDADILVDQTFGRVGEDYSQLVNDSCLFLCGTAYALLRPQFKAARAESLARTRRELKRVFISIGMTNLEKILERLLMGVALYHCPLQVDVVVSSILSRDKDFFGLINEINKSGPHNFTIHYDVAVMADLMKNADLALGAGGTSSWERCVLGLPTMLIVMADNQRQIAQGLESAGAVLNLGWHTNVSPAIVVNGLQSLGADIDRLEDMRKKAAGICDGEGAKRVRKVILDVCG